jgi:hypothetical protein
MVTWLHLAQPAIRLLGRIQYGIGPWSWKGFRGMVPRPNTAALWSDHWQAMEARLSRLTAILEELRAPAIPGGELWDLSIPAGLFGTVRVLAMVEEHGHGRQLCRFRSWPKTPVAAVGALFGFVGLAGLAGLDHAWVASAFLWLIAIVLALLIYIDCSIAMGHWRNALSEYRKRDGSLPILRRGRSGAMHSQSACVKVSAGIHN